MISKEIMDALYFHSPLFIERKVFEKSLQGWDATAIERNDGRSKTILFVALSKGPLFHFQSMNTGHPLPMREIRAFLGPIIAEHGYAETLTPVDDQRQQRFNSRIGFTKAGEDGGYIRYRIEQVD